MAPAYPDDLVRWMDKTGARGREKSLKGLKGSDRFGQQTRLADMLKLRDTSCMWPVLQKLAKSTSWLGIERLHKCVRALFIHLLLPVTTAALRQPHQKATRLSSLMPLLIYRETLQQSSIRFIVTLYGLGTNHA